MPDTSSSGGTIAILLTAILGFVGTALSQWYQARAARALVEAKSQLELLDRQEKAKADQDDRDLKARLQEAAIKERAMEVSATIERRANVIADGLHTAIEKGTNAAQEAFHESNNVNYKIADLSENLLKIQQTIAALMEKQARQQQEANAHVDSKAPDSDELSPPAGKKQQKGS